MKHLLLSKLHRSGYDLSRARPHLVDFLKSRRTDVVIDVGANAGQFGRWLRNRGYDGRIISLEPISSVFERLKAEARGDKLWETRQLAAGATSGTAEINVSAVSEFSSFLEPTDVAGRLYDDSLQSNTERVNVTTLDEFAKDLRGNIFLKIDTQGSEQLALRGAEELTKRLCGVQLELPVIHLYRDTWTLPQAIQFMMDRSFIISQIMPVNFSPTDDVSLVEVDVTFRRLDQVLDV